VVFCSDELSVEELAAKYADAYASDFELPETPSSTEVEDSDMSEQESDSEESAACTLVLFL